jgi:hypothetical protein
MAKLSGDVAIISGAGSGLGRALEKRRPCALAVLFGHRPEKGISDGVRRAILTGGGDLFAPPASGLTVELR